MQDSNYYYKQMKYYKEQIEKATEEKANYETLSIKLKQLLSGLPDIKLDLIDAESSFKNGGYISNNETFDKGILNKSYTKLESVIQNINKIIEKTSSKIMLLDENIVNYKKRYESASINYKKAYSSEVGA